MDSSISLPTRWPVGDYCVDIFVDEALIRRVPFTIGGGAKELALDKVQLLKLDTTEQGGEPLDLQEEWFTPEDGQLPRSMVFRFILNRDTAIEAVMRLFAVDKNGQGGSYEVMNCAVSADLADHVDLDASMKIPWPVGEYRVDMFVSSKLFASKEFSIRSNDGLQSLAVVSTKLLKLDSAPGADGMPIEGSNFQVEDGIAPRRIAVQLHMNKFFHPSPIQITWVAVETNPAFPNSKILQTEAPFMDVVTTSITHKRIWPVGKYQLEARSDGVLLAQVPYSIGLI